MSARKIVLIGSLALFGVLALVGLFKSPKNNKAVAASVKAKQEVVQQKQIAASPSVQQKPSIEKPQPLETIPPKSPEEVSRVDKKVLPDANHIDELFVIGSKNPTVETVTYSSRVPWIKGRPAWLADYASYYQTTRHFIARSLNHKADYFSQKIDLGDRFNVFKKDRNVQFHLLIDLSRSKLWFYLIDNDKGERLLLKSYSVGLGRKDGQKSSGYLTPLGKYLLGNKVAIYKPEVMGYFQDRKIEMIRVFGTRWIPFEQEVENCTEAAKGYGLHGAPWVEDAKTGLLYEDRTQIGKYNSDGCVRLLHEDIEEIFSIVISKPTTVEIVKDFFDAKLPGKEVEQITP